MLFEDYVKKWLSHERGPLYEEYARGYALPDLGQLPVTELRPRHLQALYDRLVTDLPLPRVADAYAVADGALDEAVSDDAIAVNFSDQITKVYHGPAPFDHLLQGTGE